MIDITELCDSSDPAIAAEARRHLETERLLQICLANQEAIRGKLAEAQNHGDNGEVSKYRFQLWAIERGIARINHRHPQALLL